MPDGSTRVKYGQGKLQEAIIDFLLEQYEPSGTKDIARAVESTRGSVRSAVRALKLKGLVIQVGRGLWVAS